MTTLHNEIMINASPDKVWTVLADLEAVQQYDPAIKRSVTVSANKSGLGAARKCELDKKNWFQEKITQWQPARAIAFELTACSLPVQKLKHSYIIEPVGDKTHVTQTMEYVMKMGLLGKLMDIIMVRKKWDKGIKLFFSGLKNYVEHGADPNLKKA